LWNRPGATLAVESTLFVAGLSVYLVATRAKDLRGVIGLWALVVFIVAIYVSSVLGPPPPSASAIAPVTLAFGIVLAPWALWVDRHRLVRREAAR
jgi:peptidoglycan/LPS O-acetylase OafA/YrhL